MIGRTTFLLGLAFSTFAFATRPPCSQVLKEAATIAQSAPTSTSSALPKRRIAVITIGQTPRPDLVQPLLPRLPQDVEIVEVGALDLLSNEQINDLKGVTAPRYPLTTRLRDGSLVVLEEEILSPLVQAAISRAEEGGIQTTMLLCAGGFNKVTASGILIRPFDAAVAAAQKHGAHRVAVVVPFEGQAAPSVLKWKSAGFESLPLVVAPGKITAEDLRDVSSMPDLFILDYFGHPAEAVQAFRNATSVPVLDLSEAAADAAAALFP